MPGLGNWLEWDRSSEFFHSGEFHNIINSSLIDTLLHRLYLKIVVFSREKTKRCFLWWLSLQKYCGHIASKIIHSQNTRQVLTKIFQPDIWEHFSWIRIAFFHSKFCMNIFRFRNLLKFGFKMMNYTPHLINFKNHQKLRYTKHEARSLLE